MAINITCPNTTLSKGERIKWIVDREFRGWITSPKLIKIINAFEPHYVINDSDSTVELISNLKSFVQENWDYRSKQKEATTKEGEAARWLLKSEKIIDDNKEIIIECAKELGLIGKENTSLEKVSYLLPLGGARMSNLRRPELAKKIIENKALEGIKIVALSGMRPIADSERVGYIDTYAPNANNEFEAISTGLEIAFDGLEDFEEEKYITENANSNYVIREYNKKYKGNTVYSIAAPSSEPEKRRANSADCFNFFFEKFDIPKGAELLNCTSQIYCTYQQVRALFYAIKYDVIFDTIGFPFALNNPVNEENNNQLSQPVNYLQEIKATVDAMYDFVNEFYLQ